MKLSNILDSLGGGFRDGDGFLTVCPAHEDSEPSLRVALSKDDKVLIKCRAGCSFSDVLAASNLTAADLFEVENDVTDAPEISTKAEEVAPEYHSELADYVATLVEIGPTLEHSGLAQQYATQRFGVTPELWDAWQLGFDDGSVAESYPSVFGSVYAKVHRLAVPFITPYGEVKGLQGRAIHDNSRAKWSGPSNPKDGGTWAKMAHFPALTGIGWVVVTEGPGDAMTAAAAGGVDAIAIRGASMVGAVLDDLAEWVGDRTVFLAGDNDAAGAKFNDDLATGLAIRNVASARVELPDGIDDISKWFEAEPDSFHTNFQEALSQAEGRSTNTREMLTVKKPDDMVPLTDVGLAMYILDRSDPIAHNPSFGFMLYRDGAWVPDRNNQVRLIVHAAARELYQKANAALDADTSSVYRSAANRLMSSREIDKILTEMGAIASVDVDQFNKHPDRLVVGNGVVNLRTGELTPHDPKMYATQRVDFDYDSETTCPRWERFLWEVFPSDPQAMAEYMQRFLGYSITGETKEQCFAILWGLGANGKSVLTNTLDHVFEELTKITPFSTFEAKSGGIPNDLAALHGARIVLASEGERGQPMAEAVIKRATGQDKIPARFLRQEFFEFKPSFTLILSTNHKPTFKSADAGLWRRVKFIPFTRFFAPEERDHYLEDELASEAEGILAWAVKGAMLWYADGLQDPQLVIDETANYKGNSDALSGFVGEVLVSTPGEWVKAADVYKAYRVWAFQNELTAKDTWGRNTFFQGLDERGYRRERHASTMQYKDVTIAPSILKEIG